ncbi:MAG: PKD domain-containing protein, partial [Bacteroidota bacterium]|nr:PKD domain-containing protein [Bacteroidota bacterium]
MNKFIRYIIASCLWTFCSAVFLSGIAVAQPILGFTIEGATVLEKNTFILAVKADSVLTGKEIYSFSFGLSYNPDYIEFQNIDSVGSVLKGWGKPIINNRTRGRIIIAGIGTSALSGKGNMFFLRFKALRGGGTSIDNISGVSSLNEGSPAMTLNSAWIQANLLSVPDIYPDDNVLFVGDEVQMYVNGGAAPYIYNTVDTAIAVISNQTMVKAKGPGLTKVFVTDKDGEKSYTSGNIDVRAIKISVIRSTAWPKDTFYLPVKIEIAPGTMVHSGYFELSFNGNIQGITRSVKSGDFNISVRNNALTNLVKVSFSSGSGISGSGILCYLGFKAINSGNHYFEFQNLQFNETLKAIAYYEYVEVNYLPTLNISPNSGSLMWGATEKITVTNGTPPMTYKVSDSNLASIDVQGNLKGLSGGKVKVTVTDSHGATKTSDDFLIFDNHFSITNADGVLDKVTRVPISTSQLPSGKEIYDFDGIISFQENELDFIGMDPVGSGMLTRIVRTGNSVHIVGATGSGIQSGIICYLKFQLKNTVALNQQATITLNSLTANEGTLYSTISSGRITRVEQLSYRPIAKAGLNKTIQEGETIQLDGSESYDEDGSPITFLWTTPAGVHLNDSTLKSPTFTAPDVKVNTAYTFTLIVNDGTSNSDPSNVTITVLQVNKRPVANSGPDKSYTEGTSVSLDGSLSFDPDLDVISYKWTSMDGIILFDPLSPSPSFIAPQVNSDKFYRFKLEVFDGVITSIPDTVKIKVLQVNKKPVAFAGGDQTVNEGSIVQLDGSLSSDGDNEPITFKWIVPSKVVLSSSTVSKPTFTAPLVQRDSVFIISLVVNDGKLNSDTDKVSINVKNLNILSTEAQILKANLVGADSTKVDQTLLQVILYMPYGFDIRALAPTFQISPKATISPASGTIRNFTAPNSYTVTAEDGTTKKTFAVSVYVPTVTLKRTLAAGWNWISLSATPPDMKVGSVFGSMTLANLDYIKSATTSALYYTTSGWVGDLSNLPQFEMLKFKKATSELFTLLGKEINPSLISIHVLTNWNRIGYILKANSAIETAFDQSTLPAGETLLKSKEAAAIYYPGTGWIGDLDSLKVLTGYMMKAASNGDLKYNASGAKLKSIQNFLFTRNDLYKNYKINPPMFEYSATMIGEVVNQKGENLIQKGDLLISYSQTEPRGVTEARFVP